MLLIFLVGIVAIMAFRRYFPILGIKCVNWGEVDINNITIIDVRDYNVAYKDSIAQAINIPIAYLNRYYTDIPNKDLYIVASDNIEKNIGIRMLRKRGFQIVGCSIQRDEPLSHSLTNC